MESKIVPFCLYKKRTIKKKIYESINDDSYFKKNKKWRREK